MHPFEIGFEAGQLTILQSLLFEPLGEAGPWNEFIRTLAALNPWFLAMAGSLLTLGLLLFAWQRPRKQPR